MHELDVFAEFMKSHQDMVFATAIRLMGNESDAADIVQEVFLKAHEHFEMLSDNPKAVGWLKTVARNLSLNHLTRYRARWRFFSEMSQDKEEYGLDRLAVCEDARSQADAHEHRRHYLEQALRKLPPAQRVPIVLYHFEEMSYEEIAAKLRISLSKVKTDIYRGREALRKWLEPSRQEEVLDDTWVASVEGATDMHLRRGMFAWPRWSEGLAH